MSGVIALELFLVGVVVGAAIGYYIGTVGARQVAHFLTVRRRFSRRRG